MPKIIGSHTPAEIKNLAINGAFDFWQRATTATINTATTQNSYLGADMFATQSGGATTKNYSIARSTTVPTLAQSGFNSTYSSLFTMITGIASPAAGDYVIPWEYRMEGLDYEKIHTKTVTFGFWAQASIAGTYSFALQNNAQNRSYVTTFAISGANTWQFIPISVTLDSTGTWQFDNTLGMRVFIGGVSGSTFQTSSLNAWQSGNLLTASTGTNYQATTSATLQIAQFSLIEGPLGLGAKGFARQGLSYQQELALCQRYAESLGGAGGATGYIGEAQATTTVRVASTFKVSKRAIPTLNFSAGAGNWNVNNTSSNTAVTTGNISLDTNATTAEMWGVNLTTSSQVAGQGVSVGLGTGAYFDAGL